MIFTLNGLGEDWFYWALTTAVRKCTPTNNLFRNTSIVLQGLIYYSFWIKLGHKKGILRTVDTLYAIPSGHGHAFFVVKYFSLASDIGNLIKFILYWIQSAALTFCIVWLLISDRKFDIYIYIYIWAGIAAGYGLNGTGIESRWGRFFLNPSLPGLGPTQCPIQQVPSLSSGWSDRSVALTTHTHLAPRIKKEYSYTFTPFMGFLCLFYGESYLYFTLYTYI